MSTSRFDHTNKAAIISTPPSTVRPDRALWVKSMHHQPTAPGQQNIPAPTTTIL